MSMRLKRLSLATNIDGGERAMQSAPREERPSSASYFSESNIHQDIKITFSLPNGGVFEEIVKNGETVQEIKRRLYSADKIPSNSMFFFNGQYMLDPLSLNDIPGVVGMSALHVEVKL